MSTFYSDRKSGFLSARKFVLNGAAACAAGLFATGNCRNANAANIVLQDGNSSVTINPTSPAGLQNWSINGVNQINQEWFWFRAGSSGGQSSLDTLGTPSTTLLDLNSNGKNDTAMLTFGPKNGLEVMLTYSLDGGQAGTKNSDLTENITLDNKGNSSVTYHFFEYANFTLGGSTTGQTVSIANANTATNSGNGYQVQTVVSPKASEYQASLSPSLLNSISSSSSYTLSDASSTTAGDPEFGFEWDVTLCPGGSAVITTDSNFTGSLVQNVPEPTAALAVMGLASLGLTRRHRAKLHSARA